MFGGHAPICGGMPNVVRIQLRGAAGLGSALTPRIPNGEGERDIAGPSRVSCNAELDGACTPDAGNEAPVLQRIDRFDSRFELRSREHAPAIEPAKPVLRW